MQGRYDGKAGAPRAWGGLDHGSNLRPARPGGRSYGWGSDPLAARNAIRRVAGIVLGAAWINPTGDR